MRNILERFLVVAVLALTLSLEVFSQSTASLSGEVTDANGAVVTGAAVVVKHHDSGAEYKTVTSDVGLFTVPALPAGIYTVNISASGFKQTIVKDVKIDVGTPANIRVTLDVGQTAESIMVEGTTALLQTQSANISTTLSVNQIGNLPLVSRNVLNFLTLMPGVNTPSIARNSTINGLPQSTINITLDGINIQDNFNKTGDGFFARIQPSIDAVEEVTISTATPGAESGGQGAVQIKFVTRSGSNKLTGSLYEYHRNPSLNSNYWFNNRDLVPVNKETGLRCDGIAAPYDPDVCKAPRDRVLFNQFGGRVGGPIVIPRLFDGKNRAFFFFNYEEFRQPSQIGRTRTIMSQLAQTGMFQYGTAQVNLLALAAANGQTSTIDPTINKLLADIRNSTNNTGGFAPNSDPNLNTFSYASSAQNARRFTTGRFDVNMTEKHRLELSYSHHDINSTPDTLNARDPQFPGFPNQGSQIGDRYTGAVAVRSTLTPKLVNEARAGLSGGPSRFNPDATADTFSGPIANQQGFALSISAAGISNPTATANPSRRNPVIMEFADTLSWVKGSHNLSFGGQFTNISLNTGNQTLVPTISFGVNTADPANAMFVGANFPGASSADITKAANLYAVLTGRVIAIAANARLDETTGKYTYLGTAVNRGRQREMGVFAQDSYRFRPNLTINYGLRWEVQFPFSTMNDSFSTTSYADLFGVSGEGNVLKPGTLPATAHPTQFTQFKNGTRAYALDANDFAPTFGFAWSPSFKDGILGKVFGQGGTTVLRGGYALAYNRNGIGDFSGIYGANPGSTITTSRDLTIGNLVTGVGADKLPVLLREQSRLGPPSFPATPVYPITGAISDSANIFDPNLKTPYSESWTFGLQREISRDTVFEIRYVGTRNLQGWTTYDFNSTQQNVLENGMLNEFKLAQSNLFANIAAGRGSTFKYFGTGTGTSPLPNTLAYFGTGNNATAAPIPKDQLAAFALDPSKYNSNNFTSSTFVNPLARFNPLPLTYAANLHSDATRRANALTAGLPSNFFLTNPDLRGGAIMTGNGGWSRYDGMQIELRRRMSKGLLVQANYTFASGFVSVRPATFRVGRFNTRGDTLTHALKINWLYELPFGRGKSFLSDSSGLVDRLVGGWEFHGTARIQSGEFIDFGNVRLVGITKKELRDSFKIRIDGPAKKVYNLPQDIIDNTIKAFSTSATSTTGYGSLGAPTGRYIAPANTETCLEVSGVECAPLNTLVSGPAFTRFDLSVVKRMKISETMNFEIRGEFLNAFNNINFFASTNNTNFTSASFGQVTSAYRDPNNTQDPGGRLVQIVLRFNF